MGANLMDTGFTIVNSIYSVKQQFAQLLGALGLRNDEYR